MKRSFVLVASLASVMATMTPSISRADVNQVHGNISLNCQIELPVFPASANTSAGSRKCGGGANTFLTGQPDSGSKDAHWVSLCGWTPSDKKSTGGGGNAAVCASGRSIFGDGGFNAYNIVYSEQCATGDVLPSTGTASGDAWLNLISIPNAQPGVLVFHFSYQRTGTVWVASLTGVSIQNIAWRHNGDRPTPNGSGSTTASGNLAFKSASGSCAAPAATTVIITGSALF